MHGEVGTVLPQWAATPEQQLRPPEGKAPPASTKVPEPGMYVFFYICSVIYQRGNR